MNSRRIINYIVSFLLIVGIFGLVGCDNPASSDGNAAEESIKSETPTYNSAQKGKDEKIAGQYIVVFNENTKNARNSADQIAQQAGGQIMHVYENAIKGFAISLPEQASQRALEAIQNNPNVDYVEADIKMFALGSQTNATWGLDRSDQRNLPIDGIYNYSDTAENVTVYIADTGINYSHIDFGGRASFGFDAFGGSGEDCDGHGTHVAGTVGGSHWGIAKNVNLVSVRVLDCNGSGTLSGVVAGIDWITANASGPSVVNMSLGGGGSITLDNAVENSIATGVTYVVAAGNNSADACNYSPARTPGAITIGSTTSSDSRSSFSNYGSCVDLFAPGSGITSAFIGSTTATAQMSGTSMSSPHVAGAAALYLQANSSAAPGEVESSLITFATQNIVTNSNTENNHLLYTMFDGSGDGGGGDENAVPSADFSYNADYLNVQFNDNSADSDGSVTTWSWDFGDGSASSSQNPSYTYNEGGTYTVSLTVTDDSGASDTVSKSISVNEQIAEEAPAITSFSIHAYLTGPWNRADANWSVSDTNLNLELVKTELLSGAAVVESIVSSVSGGSASGLHEHRTKSNADAIRLTVTDSNGNSTSSTKSLDGSDGGDGGNSTPAANFSYNTDLLNVQFTDESTDADGTIVSWAWSFGDGTSSSFQNPSHTYSQGGTYTVSLTVTDDNGDTDTVSQSISVNNATGDIALTANGYRIKGEWTTDLSWNGATTSNVDIFRNGSLVKTVGNSGSYTDSTNLKGGGSLIYQVCEAGTSTCSNEVTVNF